MLPAAAAQARLRLTTAGRDGSRRLHLPLLRGDDRGRPGLLVQAVLITVFLVAYDYLRNLAPSRAGLAFANAHRVLHLEASAHLAPEHAANSWLQAHPALALASSVYYNSAHYAVTLPLLACVYALVPGAYRRLRDVLVATNAVGLIGFWLFPLAPPRMLPGFHDTVALTHALGGWSSTISSNADEYAAMPSLHVGFALWVAVAVTVITKEAATRWRRSWRLLAGAHVVATVAVILATGNHYLLDVVGGAACLTLALALVRVARQGAGSLQRRWLERPARVSEPGLREVPVCLPTPRAVIDLTASSSPAQAPTCGEPEALGHLSR